MPDGDIDAMYAGIFLVDDGIDCDGGFAGLAVGDNQFALAAADGGQGIDCHNPGLQGVFYRLALDDIRRR